MRHRLCFLLLLLVLPLQLSWAVVGKYCRHESGLAGAHFGHHVHVHQPQPQPALAQAEPAAGDASAKPMVDGDCGFCHAGSPLTALLPLPDLPALSLALGFGAYQGGPPPLPPGHTPDRPQWPRLV